MGRGAAVGKDRPGAGGNSRRRMPGRKLEDRSATPAIRCGRPELCLAPQPAVEAATEGSREERCRTSGRASRFVR
jgi:hypothetical protein